MARGTPERVSHSEQEAYEGDKDSDTSSRTYVEISVHYKPTVYRETQMSLHAAVETEDADTS